MSKINNLSSVLAVAMTAGAIGVPANAGAAEGSLTLEEIVVTATKRASNLQDVPIAVQAMSEGTLDELGVENFTDYVNYLPNVNFAGRGPGQNDVFIRGVSTDRGSLFQAGATGSGPTVALYLDEAPITAAGRNIDLYITDMQRIEVLPGPQGTLFGASSQAGTLRLITNKPDLSEMSGKIEISAATTRHGSTSYGGEGYLNFPIIEDKLAIRVTAYDMHYGGYIDNVPGTATLGSSNPTVGGNPAFANTVFKTTDNAAEVKDNFNDSYYKGARLGLNFAVNDDWSILLQYMTQELGVDGVFDYDPAVGDLQVSRFSPDRLEDNFKQGSWTVEGRVSLLDVIYTGSYLERDVHQTIDYVGYANSGRFLPYYICDFPAYTSCEAPNAHYTGESHSTRQTHEFRVSTDSEEPLSFIGGVYYDETDGTFDQMWTYEGSIVQGVAPNAPIPTATNSNPDARIPGVVFFNDITPHTDQIAVFGELTYRLNDQLSATVGLRWYDIDLVTVGSSNFANRGVDGNFGRNLDELLSPANESDTIKKVTLNYTPNDDLLFYLTFSEGFRTGGFNRGPGLGSDGITIIPEAYKSDTINNYEFGWKTTLLDNRLRFNGSIYYIDWKDLQVNIFDQTISNLLFTDNAGTAKVTGVEGDFTFMATEQLTISSAFSYNETELIDRPDGANNLVPDGSDLALTPNFQGNMRARYDFELSNDLSAYAMVGLQYKGSNYSSIVFADRFKMDSYAVADVSFVVSKDNWSLQLAIKNITDKRAQLFISNQDEIPRIVTNRPRTATLKLTYNFN